MSAPNYSRSELLGEVDRIVNLLITAGSIQNLVAADPVDGPRLLSLSRESMNAAAIVASSHDEEVTKNSIESMASNVLEINMLIKRHIDRQLSNLGSFLDQLPVEDYVDIDNRVTDVDVVKKAAKIAEEGGLHLPEGAEIAGIRPVGSLLKLLAHFAEMAGGPEKFAEFQIKSAQNIPDEMVGTNRAIVMVLIGAISGAANARICSGETAEVTLSCLLSMAHATRDMLTLPTLSAAVSIPHLAQFVSSSIPERIMSDLKDVGIEVKEDPNKGPVKTEPAPRPSNVIEFPQSRTVH